MRIVDRFGCRAIVFDKDGTLIDTESISFEMYCRLLRCYGETYDLQMHARLMGHPDFVALRMLQERYPKFPQGDRSLFGLRQLQWNIYAEVQREFGIRALPGADEVIRACHAERIPIALATGARRDDTEAQLRALGWEAAFQAVVTAEDVRNVKPEPDLYLCAARALNVPPIECLAVEDGPNGAKSAVRAGMIVVFIRDPRFGFLMPHGASLFISSLMELLD